MKPKVLFIGSIGVVAETSELQRQAYNQALKENGVNWKWEKDVYKQLLQSNGGQDRLKMLSTATGTNLSEDQIKSIHARKTEIAGKLIKEQQIAPRPGLKNIIQQARQDNAKVAWVTTTGKENTDAILNTFNGELSESDFDHIFHRDDATNGKPSPDIYHAAVKHFNTDPSECVAIEDSLNSVLSAKGSGIFTVATLGDYHNEHVDKIADVVVDSLDKMSWSQLSQQFENN